MATGSKPWPVLTCWIYPPNTVQWQAERIYIHNDIYIYPLFRGAWKETITRALPRAPIKKDFEFLLRFWRLGFPHDAIAAAASPSFPSVVVHDSHRCVVDFVFWSSLVKAGEEEEEEE
jgi:hypothetical protein